MAEVEKYPTILRVLLTDYALLSFFAIGLPVIGISILFAKPSYEAFVALCENIGFSGSVIYWWHNRVCRAFKYGVAVQGEVLKAQSSLFGIYVIEYFFRNDGGKMIHTASLNNISRLRKIKQGQIITVLLDPKDKNRSFVKEAYVNASH